MAKRASPLKDIAPEIWAGFDDQIRDKFFYNDPTFSSVEKSEMRLDEERPWPVDDDSKRLALSYVDKLLEAPLSGNVWTEDQVMNHLELEKTPSAPWRYLGYKTRREFFESQVWMDMKDSVEEHDAVGHIYRVVPKDNWSEISDWKDDKTRTFLVPGAHVLYQQLRCFGSGTEAIKNYSWSKYGMNPFMGNVDRIARQILLTDDNGKSVFPVRLYWDVAGYDRFIYLHNVANRRLRYFTANKYNSQHVAFAKWVAEGLKRSVIILSNGDIVIRKRGNNSGSGMTTANNIEAGMEVVTDLLICAYYSKYHEFPSYDLIYKQLVYLYGDDNMSALMDEFDWLLNETMIRDRLWYFHGLKLKILGGHRETPLQEMSFLGFTFYDERGVYIPMWNRDRLLVPITYCAGKSSLPVYLQRFYSILILSYAHEELWQLLRSAYLRVLSWAQEHSGDPQVKALVRLGAPTRESLRFFYTGLEVGGGMAQKDIMSEHDNCDMSAFEQAHNYKNDLLDHCQRDRIPFPEFVTQQSGPPHRPMFAGTLLFGGKMYTAYAMTKKECEQILSFKATRMFHAANQLISESKAQSKELKKPTGFEQGSDTQKTVFWMTFLNNFQTYAELDPEERIYHPLGTLLASFTVEDKRQAAARIAQMYKAGTFNPYGNGQTNYGPLNRPISDRTTSEALKYEFKNNPVPKGLRYKFNDMNVEDHMYVCTFPLENRGGSMLDWEDYVGMEVEELNQRLEIELQNLGDKELLPYVDKDGVHHYFRYEEDGTCHEILGREKTVLEEKRLRSYLTAKSLFDRKFYFYPLNQEFKETNQSRPPDPPPMGGSYNPYGNGQTSTKYTLTRPTITKVGLLYTASSSCLLPNGVNIVGQGEDAQEAFSSWKEKVNEYIDFWAPPPPTTNLQVIFKALRSSTRPTKTPIGFVWDLPEEQAFVTFWDTYKEGGFNPYGNGQTSKVMNFKDWEKMNPKLLAGLNPAARQKKYQSYVSKKKGSKPAQTKKPVTRQQMIMAASRRGGAETFDSRVKVKLSGCAMMYAMCLNDPWLWVDRSNANRARGLKINLDEMPCIPMFPAVKTRKFYARAQGTFGCANEGDSAWIMFAPWRLANDYPTNENVSCPVLFSTPSVAWPFQQFPTVDNGAAYTDGAANLNTDYTSASLININGVGTQFRVVGASLRIQYVGNPLQAEGTFHRVIDPDHGTLSGQALIDFNQYESYTRKPVTADMFKNNVWFQVNYAPVHVDDYQFWPDSGPNATWDTAIFRNHFMGIYITGCPTGNVFSYDVVVFYEAIGREVRGKTDTPCDPTGAAIATSTLKSETQKQLDDNKSVKAALAEGAQHVTGTGVESTPMKMVETAVEMGAKLLT